MQPNIPSSNEMVTGQDKIRYGVFIIHDGCIFKVGDLVFLNKGDDLRHPQDALVYSHYVTRRQSHDGRRGAKNIHI